MPSIATLVADIVAGTVTGIAAKPASNQTTDHATISGTHRLKWESVDATFSLTPTDRLNAATGGVANGTYLHYAVDAATVGRISVTRPILVSGNFSGCAYRIYRTPMGLLGVHIARPGGVGGDANVNLMTDYATQKGWVQLQDISSMGFINNNGCKEVIMVSQLIGAAIHTAVFRVNNMGGRTGGTLHVSGV